MKSLTKILAAGTKETIKAVAKNVARWVAKNRGAVEKFAKGKPAVFPFIGIGGGLEAYAGRAECVDTIETCYSPDVPDK